MFSWVHSGIGRPLQQPNLFFLTNLLNRVHCKLLNLGRIGVSGRSRIKRQSTVALAFNPSGLLAQSARNGFLPLRQTIPPFTRRCVLKHLLCKRNLGLHSEMVKFRQMGKMLHQTRNVARDLVAQMHIARLKTKLLDASHTPTQSNQGQWFTSGGSFAVFALRPRCPSMWPRLHCTTIWKQSFLRGTWQKMPCIVHLFCL